MTPSGMLEAKFLSVFVYVFTSRSHNSHYCWMLASDTPSDLRVLAVNNTCQDTNIHEL